VTYCLRALEPPELDDSDHAGNLPTVANKARKADVTTKGWLNWAVVAERFSLKLEWRCGNREAETDGDRRCMQPIGYRISSDLPSETSESKFPPS